MFSGGFRRWAPDRPPAGLIAAPGKAACDLAAWVGQGQSPNEMRSDGPDESRPLGGGKEGSRDARAQQEEGAVPERRHKGSGHSPGQGGRGGSGSGAASRGGRCQRSQERRRRSRRGGKAGRE